MNSIPERAMAGFDLRSLEAEQLVRLEVELHRAVEGAVLAADMTTAQQQQGAGKGAAISDRTDW